MELVTCGECGRNIQYEKAELLATPDFQNGDPERAWPGGPGVFCKSCWKKRPRRIARLKKGRAILEKAARKIRETIQ